jgi:hypothetical protein
LICWGRFRSFLIRLQMRGEFEFVGAKPLGTGCLPDLNEECTGTSVKEFRGAAVRPFMQGRLTAGINFMIASGYTGQTTENFCQQNGSPTVCDPSPFQEIVGVRIPSYASASVTYRFGR